jgi:hypothetical protein
MSYGHAWVSQSRPLRRESGHLGVMVRVRVCLCWRGVFSLFFFVRVSLIVALARGDATRTVVVPCYAVCIPVKIKNKKGYTAERLLIRIGIWFPTGQRRGFMPVKRRWGEADSRVASAMFCAVASFLQWNEIRHAPVAMREEEGRF